jgi:hypothetical protein
VRPAKHAAGTAGTSPSTNAVSPPPATASPTKRPRCLSDDANPPPAAASLPSESSPTAPPATRPASAPAAAPAGGDGGDALATLAGYSDSDDDAAAS